MKIFTKNSNKGSKKGFALMLVLFVLGITMMTMATFMYTTDNAVSLNHRNNQLNRNLAMAEAATEKVLSRMIRDYKISGSSLLDSNLSSYQVFTPEVNDSVTFTNFTFYDASGFSGKITVEEAESSTFKSLSSKYEGLNGHVTTYRIVALAAEPGSLYPDLKGGIQQEVEFTQIPVFQFALFYNNLMEFTWAAEMDITGRVHGNADIYTGSSNDLRFQGDVTSVGVNENKEWIGFSELQFTGDVNFDGTKEISVSALNVPISPESDPTEIREIIEMPPAGENPQSWRGQQRMYNKAELVVRVTDGGPLVIVKNSLDSTGVVIPEEQVESFIDTSKSFSDQREGKLVKATEIDISKFNTWASTNTFVTSKLGAGVPPSIVYVSDERTVSQSQIAAVRLVNGEQLPSRGLTLATRNPLYVKGNFNQPDPARLNTSYTANTEPASLICDAITVLSSAWEDEKSNINFRARRANPTTVNAAIMTGNVETSDGATPMNGFSGGVPNLTRLLEDWKHSGQQKLTINGSMIAMFESEISNSQFRWPGYYYYAPEREFNLDRNFEEENGLPPGTPQLISVIRKTWAQVASE